VRWARGRLSGMAFKVRFAEERTGFIDYDTGDVYDFLDGGVLSIAYAAKKSKWTDTTRLVRGCGLPPSRTTPGPNRVLIRLRRTAPRPTVHIWRAELRGLSTRPSRVLRMRAVDLTNRGPGYLFPRTW